MKPISRILLALDTGGMLTDVWREALFLAETFAAKLVLVHAIPEAGEWSPEFGTLAGRVLDLFGDLAREAEDRGVEVLRPFEVHAGTPAELVLEKARERQASLVMLGAASKGVLDRLLLGSTAETVLRKAPTPVWVVRPGRAHDRLRRVLCAVDASEPGRESLAAAIPLARTYVAPLSILHVVPRSGPTHAVDCREVPDLTEPFDLHGIEVETLCYEGSVPEAVVAAANDVDPDLLVIGEAGRTGLARLLRRNTAEEVVRKLPCSLLAVKAEGSSAA
ncbi:MAG: universal stress protein [Planctomycetota bacterium]|nr:MAG: universal stress protein [Planctomycetota bacterium]